jgi:hypothetical protein
VLPNGLAGVAQRQPSPVGALEVLASRLAHRIDAPLVVELGAQPLASGITFSVQSFGIDRSLNAESRNTFRR